MTEANDEIYKMSDLPRLGPPDVNPVKVHSLAMKLFRYEPWHPDKIEMGNKVRDALIVAYEAIVNNVPACPARTRAMNALTDCRMLVNQAITFDGLV
jgi:hypothetical protein